MNKEVKPLKKRKKRKNSASSRTVTDITQNIRFLKPDSTFRFECSRCSECCRNAENSIMLESYDLYRLAVHLRNTGHRVNGIEDIMNEYTDLKTLGDSDFPIFLMKTRGQRNECVFLKDGRCSVYDVRPRACRLYPLGAWPNDTLDGFDYFVASQRQFHFKGAAIKAGDWMDEHFSSEDRAITLLDGKATVELAPILHDLQKGDAPRDRILHLMITFKYVFFELDEPFKPQYMRNIAHLKQTLPSLGKNRR